MVVLLRLRVHNVLCWCLAQKPVTCRRDVTVSEFLNGENSVDYGLRAVLPHFASSETRDLCVLFVFLLACSVKKCILAAFITALLLLSVVYMLLFLVSLAPPSVHLLTLLPYYEGRLSTPCRS
jgi:hypothetical protein